MKRLPEMPSPQEASILLLLLIQSRTSEPQPVTRVRLSELTLKRLWRRNRLNREFLEEVQEWLWHGGWTLFYAQTTYAAIKTSSVHNWSRLSSKRLSNELEEQSKGEFDYSKHVNLISSHPNFDSDD